MAQAPEYVRGESFIEYATAHPDAPLPPANLEAEFDDIKETTDALRVNAALIQRDDGKLQNQVVTTDSLSPQVAALFPSGTFLPRGLWQTATAYAARDIVEQGGGTYVCVTAHTSGTFATDKAAGKWMALSYIVTAFLLTLFDDPDASTFLSTLGFSAFSKTLIDDADATAARATLDVHSIAEEFSAIITLLAAQYIAKGDQVFGTGFHGAATKTVGAAGTILMARPASAYGVADVAALNKSIYGFTYKNNSGDPTNDLDIFTGGCMDVTGAYWIGGLSLGSFTKQSDVAWAAGNSFGGLDTGAVGNNNYYIFAIARSDTGVTDILFSLSPTTPQMPANYDFKRLIGWFKRAGGTIVAFHTYETEGGGLEFAWDAPTLDINLSNTLTTARRTDALKVPLDFSVIAHINAVSYDASSAVLVAWIYCPDQTDAAPSQSLAAPLANLGQQVVGGANGAALRVRTSATGLIAARGSVATVDTYAVSTLGFTWARRN